MDVKDLVKLLKVEPLFAPTELKAIALGTIAHNHAIAARRGRPIYASSVTKDINQFSGLAGGVDMNNLMLMAMMQQDKGPDKVEETEAAVDKIVDAVLTRLKNLPQGDQPVQVGLICMPPAVLETTQQACMLLVLNPSTVAGVVSHHDTQHQLHYLS